MSALNSNESDFIIGDDGRIGIHDHIGIRWFNPISGGRDAPAGGDGTPPAGDTPPAGGDGTPADSWVATLDPELQKAPAIKKFKGKDWTEVGPQVLKSYVNLEKWQVPGADATPEERAAFARRRGVPEKFDDYKLDVKVPDGVEWTPEIQGEFAKFAHEQGLTPGEASSVVNWYLERAGRGIDSQTTLTAEELRKTTEALQTKWGANWKRNTGLVQRAVEEYGSTEFKTLLDSVVVEGVTLGNHPAMLQFLKDYGESRLEAGFIPGDSLLVSNADAKTELDKILLDAAHPYWKGDKGALKKVSDLFALVYPDQKRP